MAKAVSLINLKGGVAKTTATIQIAECLVQKHSKRVLVVDLDPQTNATAALIGEDRWVAVDKEGQTIFQIFNDLLENTKFFDINKAIITCLESGGGRLSLLPSSIRLLDIQDRLQDISAKTHNTVFPETAIKQQLGPRLSEFDYVIFDCPPNLGNITKNGIEMSDWYIIPTVPDFLSTWGIPQIINKVAELKKVRQLSINCCGLIFTKHNSRSTFHSKTIKEYPQTFANYFIKSGHYPGVVFETKMPLANQWSEAVQYATAEESLAVKWGRTTSGPELKLYQYIENLTEEFIKYVK